MVTQSAISSGEPLSPEKLQAYLDDFYREGVTLIPGVLTADECAALRDATDQLLDSELADRPSEELFTQIVLRDTQRKDRIFLDLVVREPILGIVRAILGDDCRYITGNVIRNGGGKAIDFWHVDDANIVEFPLPPDVPRHDPRIRMPVQWMTVQIALSDIDVPAHGPTQYVPGSHYSGRRPPRDHDSPEFEGRGPVNVLCKAGDIYLQNHQCWHRGSPNRSDRVRYVLQSQYCQMWAVRRFGYCLQHGIPDEVRTSDPRLQTLLCVDNT